MEGKISIPSEKCSHSAISREYKRATMHKPHERSRLWLGTVLNGFHCQYQSSSQQTQLQR